LSSRDQIIILEIAQDKFIQEVKNEMVTATPNASSLAEVLDRILDKGVVIDIWARASLVGIEILTVESRVVVASVDTFLHYSEEMAKIEQAAIGATPKVPA
jgi:hypothetical protein